MKKQKIEDIFSSMEDFSSVPPPELWSQIEEKLNKPKKKKRVVLWWSAAACLLLGLLLPSILHFTDSSENTNLNNGNLENSRNSVVIDKEKNGIQNTKDLNQNKNTGKAIDSLHENDAKNQFNIDSQIQVQETSVAETNSKNKTDKKDSKSNTVVPANVLNQSVAYQNSGLSEEKSIVKSSKQSSTVVPANAAKQSVAYQNSNSEEKSIVKSSKKSNTVVPANTPNQSVAYQNSGLEGKSSTKSSKQSNLENKAKLSNKGISEEQIAFGKQSKFNSSAKKQLSNSIFEEQLAPKNNKNIAFNNQRYSSNNNPFANSNAYNSNNAITGKNENKRTDKAIIIKDDLKITNSLSKTDSMQLAELQNLEKGILTPEKEKEEKAKKDNLINKKERWAVAVFAGVASSENTKNEKTLGNVNDSKQSNSYGVKTKYSINKKWAVGSGLKISELGQSVANVSYLSAKSNAFFNPGTLNADSNNSPVVSADPSSQGYLFISNSTKEALKNENVQTGKLDQNLRYVEMPLEVSYSVFNKNKASINLNTGGFVGKLISNNVALDGHSIGENVNANNYVYGSTLSSTVQYRVYKKTNVFVEPAVNYYINPLNSQSFNQFQWGLNFGLNVNF
ncbi:hypothetical protein [Flavobacterium tistrianum]|uniref:hypothetical protein n=1 Tax=Flavobacterium tistrianum TaxID=1685414 RepID=UPI000DAD4158|nr:hypothetical protein [Flavobacterium tistrianum]KAF2342517.1 hypothetical protein DMB71_03570 [Flavobacterium tistrianum]